MKNETKRLQKSIDVWNIHLSDCRNEVDTCRALLTSKELERAARFFKPKDAERFILCRGLLRRILGEVLERVPSFISFKHNGHGKPFIPNADLEFNVSHSRDRLLIAVTSGRAIGIDIEFRRSGINMDTIAARWFAPEEREFYQTSEYPEEVFFDLWARKEAYAKALGIGIFRNLADMAVPLEVPSLGKDGHWFFHSTEGREAARMCGKVSRDWQTLEIDPDYAASIVFEAPAVPIRIRSSF